MVKTTAVNLGRLIMIIYGTKQCPDTAECLRALDSKGTAYDFRNIENLPYLKEFLGFRDNKPLFESVREAGGVGIPLVITDDGSLALCWEDVI